MRASNNGAMRILINEELTKTIATHFAKHTGDSRSITHFVSAILKDHFDKLSLNEDEYIVNQTREDL